MDAYDELTEHLRRIAALEGVAGLLHWDQETQMPPRGAAQRAEQAAAVAAAAHAAASDQRLPDWIAAAEPAGDPAAAVNLAEAARIHARATRVPPRLAADLARAAVEGQAAWLAAREANAFAGFARTLGRILELKRAEAACLAAEGTSAYDALLDDHEPGATAAGLAALFASLRPGLVDLAARIAAAGRPAPAFAGHFPAAAQLVLARRLGDAFGYDWAAGRLDLAAHPSSSGTGGDVRITTRIDEADPRECIYSTVHEVGHALYEQGLDPAQLLLPAGSAASMGVHESQSRLFENQIGRSRAFCAWLWPLLVETLGDAVSDGGLASPEALYRAVNAVEPGFIRTDADEVHYNLHVMLRFDLERALVAGDLAVDDLEPAWNARFLADFGRAVPDARRGVLQDVHWAVGLFGYFPTYTLGNIYAGELHAALRRALPDLDARLAAGDLAPAVQWLRANIHRRGRLLPPRRLIAAASGHEPGPGALLAYLDAKYGELYAL
ncbi:MAG TPA: carboxypeptidase M32 [Amaricoccus sp.]|nr:carboxypeptidase M32 [Amaricoccus sp.]